jgi:5'-nucleotidase
LKALADAFRPLGDVTIVAPVLEASAIGHALTLRHPLRLEAIGDRVFAVDGTPTDCVNIAVTHVFKALPDLVVSGINKGWNLGDDVTYSGTVAGALEAALLGVPALAVSLQPTRSECDRRCHAQSAASVAHLSQHQRA